MIHLILAISDDTPIHEFAMIRSLYSIREQNKAFQSVTIVGDCWYMESVCQLYNWSLLRKNVQKILLKDILEIAPTPNRKNEKVVIARPGVVFQPGFVFRLNTIFCDQNTLLLGRGTVKELQVESDGGEDIGSVHEVETNNPPTAAWIAYRSDTWAKVLFSELPFVTLWESAFVRSVLHAGWKVVDVSNRVGTSVLGGKSDLDEYSKTIWPELNFEQSELANANTD